jgi:DNA-binding transcriptional LysR family regulator
MTVDLTKLKQLLAVARTGSYRRAADELGLTQPALSRNIALLEHRFGFKIFDRGRSGAALTPVGALVVDDADSLVRHAAILERNLLLYGRGEAGQIAFGMGPQIAGFVLAKLGAQMVTTRPQLRMRCSLKTANILMRELRDDSIEMMFCASDHIPPSEEIVIEPMGVMTYGIFARAGHPMIPQGAVTLSELSAYPLVVETEHVFPSFPTNNCALVCDNASILRDIVYASDALSFASFQVAADDLAAGRLVVIDVVDLPFSSIEVGMVRLAGRAMSPAAAAVAACVRKLFAEVGEARVAATAAR